MDRRTFAKNTFQEWKVYYEEEYGVKIHTINVVCPTCDGNGRYVNPSIDSNGISSEEWAEWTDTSRDMYLSGKYDVICGECHGNNVVERLPEDAPVEQKEAWARWEESEYEYRHSLAMGY